MRWLARWGAALLLIAAGAGAAQAIPPEPVAAVRMRLAALPRIRALLPAPLGKLLAEQLRGATGIERWDATSIARAGIDPGRDLVLIIGAQGLDRAPRAARMPFSRFRDAIILLSQRGGTNPLPESWFELHVPTAQRERADATLAAALRKLSGDPKLVGKLTRGQVDGKQETYAVWGPIGGFTVAARHASNVLRLRVMPANSSPFAGGIPSLKPRERATEKRMQTCGYLDGDVGLYVDAKGFARYGQMVSLLATMSTTASLTPANKAKIFATGAAESRAFEGLYAAGRQLFTHCCENASGSRWGLTAAAARRLGFAARAHTTLVRKAVRRLAPLARAEPSRLARWLRDGGDLAHRFVGLFLWPVLLSTRVSGADSMTLRLEKSLLGARFELDREALRLAVPVGVARLLLAAPATATR